MFKIFKLVYRITALAVILSIFLLLPGQNMKKHIPILIYHGVDEKPFGAEKYFVHPSEFEKQMKYLHDNHYTPLWFSDVKDYEKCSNPVMITFDDGYDNNYYKAYPILKKYNMKATIFMVAGDIDFPNYLSTKEILQMSDIISFQSHTFSHPDLTTLSDADKTRELVKSKKILERVTKKPIIALSYPYGLFNSKVVKIASQYYNFCVTTNKGYFIYDDSDRYRLGRLYVLRSEDMNAFVKKVKVAQDP